jgi:hypothetical protein
MIISCMSNKWSRTCTRKKIPSLFIKLDISKAFDSVNWAYLLHVMQHLGFGLNWRNWISSLWCSASSSFLLNGEFGRRILHCRGVRQGDPLSPMLFLLPMGPLHILFKKAQESGLSSSLSKGSDSFRLSLYADDDAAFIKPTKMDLEATLSILQIFAEASGLFTNMNKIECYPIQCANINLDFISDRNLSISSFP